MRISDWSSDVCSSDLLFIAATATFAISRLRVRGGALVSNLALATYLVPPAFLAIPMYTVMATYGLVNSQWSLILTMVSFARSEEHTSELQSLMRISYAVFCLKKKILSNTTIHSFTTHHPHTSFN